MPQWVQDLTAGWPMILANLPTFIGIVVLITGLIWAVLAWAYGRIISHQAAEIKLLERQKSEASAVPKSGALVERASLRMHVYGDSRLPDKLSATTIWPCFSMNHPLVIINQHRPQTPTT